MSQRHIDLAHVDGIDVEHVLFLSFQSSKLNCGGVNAVDEFSRRLPTLSLF
jgi:hypothetical protein